MGIGESFSDLGCDRLGWGRVLADLRIAFRVRRMCFRREALQLLGLFRLSSVAACQTRLLVGQIVRVLVDLGALGVLCVVVARKGTPSLARESCNCCLAMLMSWSTELIRAA